jgi:hypothetical protein
MKKIWGFKLERFTHLNIPLGPFVKEMKNQNLDKGVHVLHGILGTLWNDQQHHKDISWMVINIL